MKAPHESNQSNQYPVPPQQGTGRSMRQPTAPPPSGVQPGQQHQERDPGNITLFRTSNFFVRAFEPLKKTGLLQKSDGSTTIIERIRWVSVEKQRLSAAQTRLLPDVEISTSSLSREISLPVWMEVIMILLVVCVPLTLQALNMFYYPGYTADEGNNMANVWAILHGRGLTPYEYYAYTYDHPPLGWLQIMAWLQLTGGMATFGNAINSGRIFMLVLAAASLLLLYPIAGRLTRSRSAALLAVLLFAISLLSLYYRREVLLGNIGMFWLLLSICLVTTGRSKLRTFVFAAIAMGIAILSDEIYLLFLPVMLYAVWLYATPFQRKFSLVAFIYVALAVASLYIVIALLQHRLLPTDKQHPGLLLSFVQRWQVPQANAQFSESWNNWMQLDAVLFVGGTLAMFINILCGTVNRFQLLTALLTVTGWIFLLSAKEIYPTSILLLLPFLATNIAVALNAPLRWLTHQVGFDLVRAFLLFMLIGALIPAGIQSAQPLLTGRATDPQSQAMQWIRDQVPHDKFIVTNSYMFSDLHEPGGMGVGNGQPFACAHIYTYAMIDPDLNHDPNLFCKKQLKGDWNNIDYLVVDSEMLHEITTNPQYELFNEAVHHAGEEPMKTFGNSKDGSQILIYQVIHS